jgi:hypothetical protein
MKDNFETAISTPNGTYHWPDNKAFCCIRGLKNRKGNYFSLFYGDSTRTSYFWWTYDKYIVGHNSAVKMIGEEGVVLPTGI